MRTLVAMLLGACAAPAAPMPTAAAATSDPSQAAATVQGAAPATSPAPPAPDASPTGPTSVAAATAIPDRAELGTVPTTIATGGFLAPNRRDWPCARREVPDRITWYTYGVVATCELPVWSVIEGITGCVDRVIVKSNGKFFDVARMHYAGGRLDVRESNLGTDRFVWDEGVPHENNEPPPHRSPGRLSQSIVDHDVLDVDARGRPLRGFSADRNWTVQSSVEFTWEGDRLTAIQYYLRGDPGTRYELIYDCKGLPRGPSANAGGALGVPL